MRRGGRTTDDGQTQLTELGRVVRQRRIAHGQSQRTLAAAIRQSQDYISKLELGEVWRVNDEVLERLAAALDMPVSLLIAARDQVLVETRDELAQVWQVSPRPARDLIALIPYLRQDDLAVLVRLARVMATGQRLTHGE